MFNKGKATLIAVLCSIAILISIMVMEWIFPFQNVVNIPLSSHASRYIGWKLVWLIPLCFLLHKNKPDGDDTKFKKVLNTDIIAFLVFTEIGIPKFIYDIQKQRAKKEGITDVKMKKMSGNEKNSIAEDNGASAFIGVFIMPLFCFILLAIVFYQLLPKDYIHGFIYLFCLIPLFIFISIYIALVNALLVSKKKEKLKDIKASDAL